MDGVEADDALEEIEVASSAPLLEMLTATIVALSESLDMMCCIARWATKNCGGTCTSTTFCHNTILLCTYRTIRVEKVSVCASYVSAEKCHSMCATDNQCDKTRYIIPK